MTKKQTQYLLFLLTHLSKQERLKCIEIVNRNTDEYTLIGELEEFTYQTVYTNWYNQRKDPPKPFEDQWPSPSLRHIEGYAPHLKKSQKIALLHKQYLQDYETMCSYQEWSENRD